MPSLAVRATPREIMLVEQAKCMLAEARTINEVKDIRDKAMAVRMYVKQQGQGLEAQNNAAEIVLWAERRMGELLKEMPKHPGGQPAKNRSQHANGSSTLSDMGVKGDQSSRAQAIADVPEEEFAKHIEETKAKGKRVTTRSALNLAKKRKKKAVAAKIAAEPPPFPTGPFRVIVVDPPWQYDCRTEDATHRGVTPYPSMTVEQIKAMPVASIAHEDCILWLWTTNAFMEDAYSIARAWGFQVKTILTWAKDCMGVGNWLRGQTEHCLMAVRGKPTVTLTNQTTLLEAPVREHSRKPDEFYQLVEVLCPGSKVELFSRQPRDGWSQHGAEVSTYLSN